MGDNTKPQMITSGKVQTNDHEVNVLVETKTSANRHCSHLDKEVTIDKILSNGDILEMWENREDKSDLLEIAKEWLMRQDGYATSNIVDDTSGITYGNIVKYNINKGNSEC